MPSPRASPTIRPSSPLSYNGYKAAIHYDTLSPSSTRQIHNRSAQKPRGRLPNNSLKLPSLPRFHPANFPSSHSSLQTTPDGSSSSPQPPVSPRSHQRIYSDAQKHLLSYQRDTVLAAARAVTPTHDGGPVSPRLVPLGSPGPVTPLVLEGEEGYLVAGARSAGNTVPSAELVEKVINEEIGRYRSSRDDSARSSNAR